MRNKKWKIPDKEGLSGWLSLPIMYFNNQGFATILAVFQHLRQNRAQRKGERRIKLR